MTRLVALLQQRFRKKEKSKMITLVKKESENNLTVFSGIFGQGHLAEKEREELSVLLHKYIIEDRSDIKQDLNYLTAITSEIKAINNQAAILQGERIKKAQQILKKYQEGAFTAWLISTYGNRQTPYNLLQYYEFYTKMPKALHPQIETMPRQAIYTLASREGRLAKKEEIVRNYKGETKQQVISLIRSLFPLDEKDRRRENIGETAIKTLKQLRMTFLKNKVKLSKKQKNVLKELLVQFCSTVDACDTLE